MQMTPRDLERGSFPSLSVRGVDDDDVVTSRSQTIGVLINDFEAPGGLMTRTRQKEGYLHSFSPSAKNWLERKDR